MLVFSRPPLSKNNFKKFIRNIHYSPPNSSPPGGFSLPMAIGNDAWGVVVFIVATLFLAVPSMAQNQNSVGVGTTSPNPRAVLELVHNTPQGFLAPRLDSQERSNLGSLLNNGDIGMLVYDSDDNMFYYWVGGNTGWNPLLDGTVGTSDLTDGAVTRSKLNDNVAGAGLGRDSNGALRINIGGPNHLEINSNDILKIADDGVGEDQIVENAVDTDHIKDGEVKSADIENGAVGNGKLATDAVSSIKIQNDAVTTPKIANLNVTNAKIANDAVTLAKLAGSWGASPNQFLTTDGSGDPQYESKASVISSIAGLGLVDAGGGVLNVDPDASTIGFNGGTQLEVLDDAISTAKIQYLAVNANKFLGQFTIGNDPGMLIPDVDGPPIDNFYDTEWFSPGPDKVITTDIFGNFNAEDRSNFSSGTLPLGNVFVGDAANLAQPLIANGNGNILIGQGGPSNTILSLPVTGDVFLDRDGITDIQPNVVGNTELNKTLIEISGFAAAIAPVDLGGENIISLAEPTAAQDAATMNYVDVTVAAISVDNGLTENVTNNFQLGGTLITPTTITTNGNDLTFDNTGGGDVIIDNSNAGTGGDFQITSQGGNNFIVDNFGVTTIDNDVNLGSDLDVNGATTLDQTTINTSDGNLLVNGTNSVDIDVPVDVQATGAISLDATTSSNFTVAGNSLTLSTTGSSPVNITSAGQMDIDAAGAGGVRIDASGGSIGIGTDADDENINIGTAGDRTITLGTSGANTGIDIDAGSNGITLDGEGASNFTVDGADLTLSTANSGDVAVTAADNVEINASNTQVVSGFSS